MKKQITRRDFLKLAGLFPVSLAAPRLANALPLGGQNGGQQNVIIVVFDAFSAHNISMHGYGRETAPNLARLAEKAIVYHNHYAGGNFTAPGTASLLTGTLPWTHRSFHHAGRVDEEFVKDNFFTAFNKHYRLAYSHNPMANGLLGQLKESLDDLVPRGKLFLKNDTFIQSLFENDDDVATVSWLRGMENKEEGFSYSLFIPHLLNAFDAFQDRKIADLQSQFPIGLPRIFTDNYYMLEDAIDWFGNELDNLPKPFISYLHFMPPHAPYRTHQEFYGRFKDDGWIPVPKPFDLFSRDEDRNFERMMKKRTLYDEFVLYVDREFGKFFDHLDRAGLLENTWVVLTSDHGEMFERGINGHTTPVLYDPVIRIPLMIFEPGRKTRTDVHVPTSAIDILPTLLHLTGQPPAPWAEGIMLPPFSDLHPGEDRSVYSLEARKSGKYAPLRVATTALIKGEYKLMYFSGYEELGSKGERVELYDIRNDPEEMNNLFNTKKETAAELLNDLKTKLAEVNEPYL